MLTFFTGKMMMGSIKRRIEFLVINFINEIEIYLFFISFFIYLGIFIILGIKIGIKYYKFKNLRLHAFPISDSFTLISE